MNKAIVTNRTVDRQAKISTREALINTATQLFSQHGYVGTSIESITQICGIKKASLFHHFKSKQDLVIAVINAETNFCINYLLKDSIESSISEQDVAEFSQRCITYFSKPGAYAMMMLSMELNEQHDLYVEVQKYFKLLQQTFSQYIAASASKNNAQLDEQLFIQITGRMILARVFESNQYFDELKSWIDNLMGIKSILV